MSYDTRCFELAEWFLADESRHLQGRASGLAQAIQDAIEDWLEANRDEPETA